MTWRPFASRREPSNPRKVDGKCLTVEVSWDDTGITFRPIPVVAGWLDTPSALGVDSEVILALRQLKDEGFLELADELARIEWGSYFKLRSSNEHVGSMGLIKLPPSETWRASLSSRGALSDPDFSVAIQSWRDAQGNQPRGNVDIVGAVLICAGKAVLMSEATWKMAQSIAKRRRKQASGWSPDENRRDWSRIRAHAVAAGADLSDFLKKTVVLTPARLHIEMRKADVSGDRLVEIIPSFDGAPARWIEIFDRSSDVPERYDVPDGAGLVQVLLPEDVRTVLREIRRMPGRRIVGERAEAFVRNPFAALGPAAATAIDPDQFERAREGAGIIFARFTPKVLCDEHGYPYDIGLIVEESYDGVIRAEEAKFESAHELEGFLAKLDGRIASGAQCCHWRGFDLEVLGDTPSHADSLREALRQMLEVRRVKASDIFDLSKYSDRVGGFGAEKPYYSPFISKKSDAEGWFPANVDLGLCFTPAGGETIAIALDDRNLEAFRVEAQRANDEKCECFTFPGCPKPVPVAWAMEALRTFGTVNQQVSQGSFEPMSPKGNLQTAERKGLVVKPNVDTLDYEERRGSLVKGRQPPQLPRCLRGGVSLKQHQLAGLSWLQHMWRSSPNACRGALLGDDMGLGKTIQLLTFMAAAIEEDPGMDPFLVVAPVALLDNWQLEIDKFFEGGSLAVLTLYGPTLASKRIPKSALDDILVAAGSPKLLANGWLGDSKIVLTTYETLRDLEFSLAAQRWSGMVCDEAQKIKNPNALVTRAAKKQNARLKIACTGTPVENTLADLWCLFDFVQPGLLGALKDFGSKYRRPIEAETEEEKARIGELRKLIEPQLLRRMKAEVAKDLPAKIEYRGCSALPLSKTQRALYADAIAQYRERTDSQATGLQSPLGLLQYLRRLCSDPRPSGGIATGEQSIEQVKTASPKMAWMLKRLADIKGLQEKVIVFCEFRDLQRTLQRAIFDSFGFVPDVINGDTSVNSANAHSRQRRIDAFQMLPGFGVIVLSPLAVGFGVNIQAANHVVHFTRTWNPAKEDQATDRAYRIGQKKDVYVYYPVVVAQDFLTFDAKLHTLLNRKRALSTDMLNGAGEISFADFGDLEAPGGGNAFGEELLSADDIPSLDAGTF